MMRTPLRFTLALLLLVAAACATPRGQSDEPRPQDAGASVRVQNQAWLDMNVFVLQTGGSRIRLGTVTATSIATFRIPVSLVGPGQQLRFLVDPVGSSQTATSFDVFVRGGERVSLVIPPGVGR